MDLWQQEAVLDAVERMLRAVLPPAVARRMSPPFEEEYDESVTHDGREHYVFLLAELEPDAGLMSIESVAVVPAR